MQTQFFPSSERGKKDIGWLRSNFVFSFSDYSNPVRSAFGSLVAFNDDYVDAGKGFGLHPHINMEIISVMLKGSMNHKDSMGYSSVVSEDSVQIMSAGSGLRHEEYNVGTDTVNFLQIWIEPKLQNVLPRYQSRQFPKEKRRNQLTTILSSEEGQAHCWINQNARLSLGLFTAGQTVPYSFNPTNKCLFIFNIGGEIKIAGQTLKTRDAIGIWDSGEVALEILRDSEFLVIETVINQK
jgi:redox-sensitive bicupin YhaK (pirin superfamily)